MIQVPDASGSPPGSLLCSAPLEEKKSTLWGKAILSHVAHRLTLASTHSGVLKVHWVTDSGCRLQWHLLMRVIRLESGNKITQVLVLMMITKEIIMIMSLKIWGIYGQKMSPLPVLIMISKMHFNCGALQYSEDSYSQLWFGFLLLHGSHPLQWAKCSYFFQSMFPVGCLMLCNSCLRVLQPPSHSRSVYPLAYHQNVSVSRQPVFVKSFVIILRPPLGCTPRHLCKYVPLRLTLAFRSTSFWRRLGKTRVIKARSK